MTICLMAGAAFIGAIEKSNGTLLTLEKPLFIHSKSDCYMSALFNVLFLATKFLEFIDSNNSEECTETFSILVQIHHEIYKNENPMIKLDNYGSCLLECLRFPRDDDYGNEQECGEFLMKLLDQLCKDDRTGKYLKFQRKEGYPIEYFQDKLCISFENDIQSIIYEQYIDLIESTACVSNEIAISVSNAPSFIFVKRNLFKDFIPAEKCCHTLILNQFTYKSIGLVCWNRSPKHFYCILVDKDEKLFKVDSIKSNISQPMNEIANCHIIVYQKKED